jgi:ubiquinol-cytochrome c reductase cytochrome b subunit
MSTPAHIVPEWYFLPFYAILRSIPNKLGGVVAMVAAILILMLIPFSNTSKIRSSNFRPIFAFSYWFLFADFVLLGWIGQKPVESPYIEIGMGATLFYFVYLLFLLPLIGVLENKLLINDFDGTSTYEDFVSLDSTVISKPVLVKEIFDRSKISKGLV